MATYLNPSKGYHNWLEKRGHNEEMRIKIIREFKKACNIKTIPNGRYRSDSKIARKHDEIFKRFIMWYTTDVYY